MVAKVSGKELVLDAEVLGGVVGEVCNGIGINGKGLFKEFEVGGWVLKLVLNVGEFDGEVLDVLDSS